MTQTTIEPQEKIAPQSIQEPPKQAPNAVKIVFTQKLPTLVKQEFKKSFSAKDHFEDGKFWWTVPIEHKLFAEVFLTKAGVEFTPPEDTWERFHSLSKSEQYEERLEQAKQFVTAEACKDVNRVQLHFDDYNERYGTTLKIKYFNGKSLDEVKDLASPDNPQQAAYFVLLFEMSRKLPSKQAKISNIDNKIKGLREDRKNPTSVRHGDYTVEESGLYYDPEKKIAKIGEPEREGEPEKESKIRICSPIWPEAHLRNKDGKDHSLLLRVHDGEKEHLWAMPRRLITKINDILDVLLDFGQDVPTHQKKREHLQTFLNKAKPSKRLRCVDKAGWHGQQYVFPNGQVIGPGKDGEGVYPLNDICPRGVETRGSLQEWQVKILRLCKGNSRLIFCIGTAFASLCLIDEDSGGFNFKGRSSIGKTKCLRVGISPIGSRDYQRSWKTTANGLEGVCALHNDSLLPLDEFGQQEADEAGEIAYMVSSGIGKQRASRDGSARDPRTWRVMVLSTGEVGLESHMHEGRKKVRAGQLARITDIPADAGKGFGCFENLHELANGGDFADELDRLCSQYYGTAGRAFVEKIVEYGVENARRDIRFAADGFVAEKAFNYDGQVKRVARRFGLVYAALVLATKLGVTPGLSEEESKEAVSSCYKAWLDDRGTGGAMETHTLIEQVIGMLQENEEGKFVNKNDPFDEKRIRNTIWGYREGAIFYVFPKAFKEICVGYEDAAKILIEEKLLLPGSDGKSSQSLRIQAHCKSGKSRFYVINLDYKNEED